MRLSFTLGAGELLALTGRNGSGKTTLLRALALLVRPDAGTVRWQGADIRAEPETWRGRLAWLGHLEGLKGDLSVRENLLVAERLRGAPPAEDRLDGALAAFDLPALAARPVRTLSAGQRRRVALARVALSQAPIWLLDEPLNALDAPAQAAFRAVLQNHLAAGGLRDCRHPRRPRHAGRARAGAGSSAHTPLPAREEAGEGCARRRPSTGLPLAGRGT